MVNRDELLHWLHTLTRDSCIGIDEGGLTLVEVLADDTLGEAYIEVGGVPECCEGPCTAACMPGEACPVCGKVCPEEGEEGGD